MNTRPLKKQNSSVTRRSPFPDLKPVLDDLYIHYDKRYISTDPLRLVKFFSSPKDREIMAVLMSALAFGQVDQIIRAGEQGITLMNNHPHDFVMRLNPATETKRWQSFYYRMVRGSDVLRLLYTVKIMIDRHGSLKEWFRAHVQSDDSYLLNAWSRAVKELKETDQNEWRWKKSQGVGFRHLLPDPDRQGPCKRPNLMLRWLVRSDGIDTGLWSSFPAEKLLIPVDTHIHRIALRLGLTKRKDVSVKTAIDITERLKRFDPDDPVKYDFALCRLGILKECTKRADPSKCAECALRFRCRLK